MPYLQYRFGVALAGSPDYFAQSVGPVGGQLTTVAYTDADREIIKQAAKELGYKSWKRTSNKSEELDDKIINKVSPVAKVKKNKYGV